MSEHHADGNSLKSSGYTLHCDCSDCLSHLLELTLRAEKAEKELEEAKGSLLGLASTAAQYVQERDGAVAHAKAVEQELGQVRSHLSATRERVEKLPRYVTSEGPFVIRSEVLAALGVVKESLTTERKPVCSHCNDSHRVWLESREREIGCNYCPRPCSKCGAAYCARTPCPCDCHKPVGG